MLKKLSLQKQLIVICAFMALIVSGLFAIVDQNLTSVIDKEMYGVLERSLDDYYAYHFSPKYEESDKQIYHFTYDVEHDILYSSQSLSPKESQKLAQTFSSELFEMINDNKNNLQNKVKQGKRTIYYQIKRTDDQTYIVSLLYSDYSKELMNNFKQQIIYIFYGAFALLAVVLFFWVSSLIKPLKIIKRYIDDIKEDKDNTVPIKIDRNDEIGILSSSIVEMKEELDKQNEIKEEMIHNISHDLKTPISIIQSYAQSIKDGVYPYGNKESSLDIIIENSNRLEKKVRSLLYLNRLDYLSGQVSDDICHMKELIEHIILQMNNVHYEIHITSDLDDVDFKGKEEHWRICIENIIENASRYVKSEIRITLKEDQLEIYNDGEPIDVEKPELLFQPYETGHKGQFGLGLSIVYKTVTMYGYSVEALNKDNGVSFIIKKKNLA